MTEIQIDLTSMRGCAVKKMVIVSLVDFFYCKDAISCTYTEYKEIFIYSDVVDCN